MGDIKVTEGQENEDGSVNFTIEGITDEEFNHVLRKGIQVLVADTIEQQKNGLVVTAPETGSYDKDTHTWEISKEEADALFQIGAVAILQEHIDRETTNET